MEETADRAGRAAAALAAGTAALLAAALAAPCGQALAWKHSDEMHIHFDGITKSQVVNAEGRRIVFDPVGEDEAEYIDGGDMDAWGGSEFHEGAWLARYDVPWSSSFALEATSKKGGVGSMNVWDRDAYRSGGSATVAARGSRRTAISVSDGGEWSVEIANPKAAGNKGKYYADLVSYTDKRTFIVRGRASADVRISTVPGGATIKGDAGKAALELENDPVTHRYYLLGRGEHRVSWDADGITKVTRAVRITNGRTSHRHVCGLRARSINSGRDALLTWKIPKKARSYRVYRWDAAGKRWRAEALRRGAKSNFFCARGCGPGAMHRFRVRAYADKAGRKPLGKASYAVSVASSADAKRRNASSVSVRRHYGWDWPDEAVDPRFGVDGDPGDPVALRARALDAGGKKAASQKFTWWTSDPKVARFDDPKKGKLRLLKKGTCKVWAKAHDGVNSPKVKVKVG